MLFGGKNPDDIERLRAKGGNRCLLWFEEMAAIRLLQDAYDIAEPGLRADDHPHWIASTTPKPRPFITGGPKREGGLMQRPDVVVTHATTFDNPHLPAVQKQRLAERYEGTTIGRQELLGQIVEDVPGALWSFAEIDQDRVTEHPDLTKVAVAVDPPGGATECGVIIAGRARIDGQDHFYVLEDASGQLTPNGWGRRVIDRYHTHQASKVIAEANFGGDMVESVIRHNEPDVPFELVRATRGKAVRAAPVHDLYEQHRVHHIGNLSKLEYEMTHWDPDESDWSPNRLDALVWAVTWLADLGRDPKIWFA
jgi:phage terminase large subunit-like protein